MLQRPRGRLVAVTASTKGRPVAARRPWRWEAAREAGGGHCTDEGEADGGTRSEGRRGRCGDCGTGRPRGRPRNRREGRTAAARREASMRGEREEREMRPAGGLGGWAWDGLEN